MQVVVAKVELTLSFECYRRIRLKEINSYFDSMNRRGMFEFGITVICNAIYQPLISRRPHLASSASEHNVRVPHIRACP